MPEFGTEKIGSQRLPTDPERATRAEKASREARARTQEDHEGGVGLEYDLLLAKNPEEVTRTTFEIMGAFENNLDTSEGDIDEWDLKTVKKFLGTKKSHLSVPLEELFNSRIVSKEKNIYERPDGTLAYEKEGESRYALEVIIEPTDDREVGYDLDADGKKIVRHFETGQMRPKSRFGATNEERQKTAEVYENLLKLVKVREAITQYASYVDDHSEDLSGLVKRFIFKLIRPQGLHHLWDTEIKGCPLGKSLTGSEYRKGHEFGDMQSFAYGCYMIIGLSEKKQELQAFLQRPQATEILFPNGEEDTKKYVGDVGSWTDGEMHKDIDSKNGLRKRSDLQGENDRGQRGEKGFSLTEYGNQWADYDSASFEELRRRIRVIMGGENNPYVIQAEQKAYEVFRGFKDAADMAGAQWRVDESTEKGYAKRQKMMAQVPEFKGLVCFTEMGHNVTTDDVKLVDTMAYRAMYWGKEREGNMPSNIARVRRFSVGLLKSLQGENADGKNRTFYELYLGYGTKDQPGYEVPHRLGDLPLMHMDRKAISGIYLPDYMAAGDESGHFDPFSFLTKPQNAPWETLTTSDGVHTFWKKINFCTPNQVVLNGRLRQLKADGSEKTEGEVAAEVQEARYKLFNDVLSGAQDYTTAWHNKRTSEIRPLKIESLEQQINRAIRIFRKEIGAEDKINEVKFIGKETG